MINLDDLQAIKVLDKSHVLESIQKLPDQCRQAWDEGFAVSFPTDYFKVKNIVIAGMGGSAYGSRMVKSHYDGAEITAIPVEAVSNYWLPGYVGRDSLVVLSSYSGDTEEVLSCANQAHDKHAKICGITTGRDLAHFLKNNDYPAYIFTPRHNPSRQPRTGVGYMVIGLMALLAKLGKIPLGQKEIEQLVEFLRYQQSTLDTNTLQVMNKAKQFAKMLLGMNPIFIVADFLEGTSYAVGNIFHETAKQLAFAFTIPDLNHHLLEGLRFPSDNRKFFKAIFVNSPLYWEKSQKRMQLTKEIVEKNGIATEQITLTAHSALIQSMEFINFGAWLTFYLAMLNDIDPGSIPWVDYFKKQLKKN